MVGGPFMVIRSADGWRIRKWWENQPMVEGTADGWMIS
jgi:hypothetical protein